MCCDCVKQALRYAIRVRIKKTHPGELVNFGKPRKQFREAIPQSQIFAIRSRVLPNQSYFVGARCGQILRFLHYRLKTTAAEFSAQLRNDAEAAWMIAAFRHFDVRGMLGCRDDARREVVIKKRGRLRWENL